MTLSIWVGLFGIVAGAVAAVYFRKRLGKPEFLWMVGLAALAPGWLIALTGLLDGLSGENPDKGLKAFLALSSAAALIGVIATEFCVRWLKAHAAWAPRVLYWLLGAVALLPSWVLLLWRVA
ncbi:MAG: hypothetical protein OXF11_16990 [Deltaproteobacteria bacterium]|nr:hypothetical protein [Deltaproteobacteria bacterium]